MYNLLGYVPTKEPRKRNPQGFLFLSPAIIIVMNKVYIFFGPPSSGKSYLGKKFAEMRGYNFYEADDDYLPIYRERVKISDEERQKVFNEFYSKVIYKIKELLQQGKPVVVASALGNNVNRKRFIDAFKESAVFILVKSSADLLIENAVKREFPVLESIELTEEKEQSLREHLVKKINSFEKPNFRHLIIDNDYTDKTLVKLSDIV